MTPIDAQVTQRSFARVGTLMFVGNTLAGVLVYAVQITMGRMLALQDYGLFTALLGIFNLTAIPLTALLMVVTRGVAQELGRGDLEAVWAIRRQAVRELALGGGVAVLVALSLSGLLAAVLDSTSIWPVVLLWIAVGFNIATAMWGATLQGMQRFPILAGINIAIAALRLVSCVALVAIGLGVVGSMLGLVLAAAVGGVVAWVAIERGLPHRRGDEVKRQLFGSRAAIALASSNLAFVALTQLDYILVRIFCSAEQASHYAAAAVLAKSVLWLPVGIVIAMFPTVASRVAQSRPSRHLLFQSLSMTLITSGLVAGVLAIGAGMWIGLLYGSKFAAASPYLGWLSLIYLPMAVVLVVDNYQLAMHRTRFIVLYALGVLAEVLAFIVPGGTLERLIAVLAAVSGACLLWALWIVVEQVRGRGAGALRESGASGAGS